MQQPTPTNATVRWIDLIRAGDQQELGAAIRRLAGMAAMAHMQQAAAETVAGAADRTWDKCEAHGGASGLVVVPPHAEPVRTEVNQ